MFRRCLRYDNDCPDIGDVLIPPFPPDDDWLVKRFPMKPKLTTLYDGYTWVWRHVPSDDKPSLSAIVYRGRGSTSTTYLFTELMFVFGDDEPEKKMEYARESGNCERINEVGYELVDHELNIWLPWPQLQV